MCSVYLAFSGDLIAQMPCSAESTPPFGLSSQPSGILSPIGCELEVAGMRGCVHGDTGVGAGTTACEHAAGAGTSSFKVIGTEPPSSLGLTSRSADSSSTFVRLGIRNGFDFFSVVIGGVRAAKARRPPSFYTPPVLRERSETDEISDHERGRTSRCC